ncbi:hypothetical protein [Paractinoplanes rishiriensis]|uniref:Uncharacterized protein n=1 Tax=Paractinoplanes rishiriensis TaxID=1050105 RepID=A0A919MZN5_9ACTN|nr:hypothetical protein [Actinoplanes rishiriensis]GIF01754.1 hypothetical protein Ari01nite_92180 [Actinoplanes rishiriensis]
MSNRPTLQFPAPSGHPVRSSRRAWRTAAVALLSTLVLLLPIVMYLLLHDGDRETPAPGDAAPTPATATSPPSTTRPPAGAPNGRISLTTLGNSTVEIPAWPADNLQGPSGRVHFRDGAVQIPQTGTAPAHRPPKGMELVILAVTYGDVDRDGADETVAEIGCLTEGGSKQIVAFDRNAAGRIVTMGRVVATTGEIRDIDTGSTRIGTSGTVTTRVGDYQVCCGDETPQVWQHRGYRWQGARFHQVAGPTRMTANPALTETSVAAGSIVLGPVVDGYRYGTLTVTVRHGWGTRPANLAIEFFPGSGLERAGSSWPPVTTPPTSPGFVVAVAPPPARGTASHTFAVRRPATVTGRTLELEVYGTTAASVRLAESNPWNNGVTVPIRAVD